MSVDGVASSSPAEFFQGIIGQLQREEEVKGIRYVLAWDIEKSGPRTDKHSMLAIGAVVLRVRDDKRLAEIRLFMKMEEGHDFSECCRKEYWYNWAQFPNNKRVLELIEKEGVHPREGIAKIAAWLDHQERTYGKDLALTTDNPASDAAWVSHYFQKYLDRNPMIHPFGDESKYRRLHHSNMFGRCLSLDDGSGGDWKQRLRDMGVEVPPEDLHDHDPLNDATWIAKLYTACIRCVRKQRQQRERWARMGESLGAIGSPLTASRSHSAPTTTVVHRYRPLQGGARQPFSQQPDLAHPRPQASFAPFWVRPVQTDPASPPAAHGNPGDVAMATPRQDAGSV